MPRRQPPEATHASALESELGRLPERLGKGCVERPGLDLEADVLAAFGTAVVGVGGEWVAAEGLFDDLRVEAVGVVGAEQVPALAAREGNVEERLPWRSFRPSIQSTWNCCRLLALPDQRTTSKMSFTAFSGKGWSVN
jgi:hypothetical protein